MADDRPTGLIGAATARPSVGYLWFRWLFSVAGKVLFRVEVSGLENLPRHPDGRPAGGYICAGLPHRTWVEPFVLMFVLPAKPRIVMLGEGATALGTPWRARLVRWVGGVVPLWPGSGRRGLEAVMTATAAAVEAGAVVAVFPEVGRPSRPPGLRRVSIGAVRMAQRARAPILPVVFGGSHDVYFRRRIVVRFLPPIGAPPAAANREGIDAYLAVLLGQAQAAADEVHRLAQVGAPARRWGRWLHGPFPRVD
jgi:1-acyl-sn-glycerol-3-phosphate acyltransferase